MSAGKPRHSWDPELSVRETDGTLTSQCRNCGMIQRHGWYRGGLPHRRIYDVLQWFSPDGVLVGIRPVASTGAPPTAPDLAESFAGVPVRGMPYCPKERAAWRVVRTVADCW